VSGAVPVAIVEMSLVPWTVLEAVTAPAVSTVNTSVAVVLRIRLVP